MFWVLVFQTDLTDCLYIFRSLLNWAWYILIDTLIKLSLWLIRIFNFGWFLPNFCLQVLLGRILPKFLKFLISHLWKSSCFHEIRYLCILVDQHIIVIINITDFLLLRSLLCVILIYLFLIENIIKLICSIIQTLKTFRLIFCSLIWTFLIAASWVICQRLIIRITFKH